MFRQIKRTHIHVDSLMHFVGELIHIYS